MCCGRDRTGWSNKENNWRKNQRKIVFYQPSIWGGWYFFDLFQKWMGNNINIETKDWSDFYNSTNEFRFWEMSGIQVEHFSLPDRERTGLL